jgi:hypothetical protein
MLQLGEPKQIRLCLVPRRQLQEWPYKPLLPKKLDKLGPRILFLGSRSQRGPFELGFQRDLEASQRY